VVRLNRPSAFGGPADFIFPVEVENPEFGKPLVDPAAEALKAKFGGARIISLRRGANEVELQKSNPAEQILPAKIADTYITSSTAHWDSRIANYGNEPYMTLGTKTGTNGPSRALVKVDLSAILAGAQLVGAQLRLTLAVVPYTAAKNATISAYAVKRPWNEVQVEGIGASWYGPLYGGNPTHPNPKNVMWGKGGCDDTTADRVAEAAGSVSITGFPAKDERRRMITLDVTDTVKAWAAGKLPNHGLLLLIEGDGCVDICSSEFQDYPFRPTLVLALDPKK